MNLNARLPSWLLCVALAGHVGCDALKPEALERETSAVTKTGPTLFDKDALADMLSRLRAEVGTEIKALELRITPTKLTLQAQSATNAARVVQYECVSDHIAGPIPVELQGEGDLEENLFALSRVSLDGVPKLASMAVEQVDPKNGVVEAVVVRRNLPFTDDVQMRVFVKSPRLSGHLDADATATPLSDQDEDSEARHRAPD